MNYLEVLHIIKFVKQKNTDKKIQATLKTLAKTHTSKGTNKKEQDDVKKQ